MCVCAHLSITENLFFLLLRGCGQFNFTKTHAMEIYHKLSRCTEMSHQLHTKFYLFSFASIIPLNQFRKILTIRYRSNCNRRQISLWNNLSVNCVQKCNQFQVEWHTHFLCFCLHGISCTVDNILPNYEPFFFRAVIRPRIRATKNV